MTAVVPDTSIAGLMFRNSPAFAPYNLALDEYTLVTGFQAVAEIGSGALAAGWGAPQTLITQRIAQELGLVPEGSALVNHLGGSGLFDVYTIDIALQNGVRVADLGVLCGDCSGCDVLIGMDIISMGDLAVSSFEGKTTMPFRGRSITITDYETVPAGEQ